MLERWSHVRTIVLRHRLPDASRFVQRVASAFVQHGLATATEGVALRMILSQFFARADSVKVAQGRDPSKRRFRDQLRLPDEGR